MDRTARRHLRAGWRRRPARRRRLLGALRYPRKGRPRIVGVEPECAACVLAVGAPRPGHDARRAVRDRHGWTAMRRGITQSPSRRVEHARGRLRRGIEDAWAFQAIRALARPDGNDAAIAAGASGAASLGGPLATLADAAARDFQADLGLGWTSRVMAIVTEAVTELATRRRSTPRPPATSLTWQMARWRSSRSSLSTPRPTNEHPRRPGMEPSDDKPRFLNVLPALHGLAQPLR